MELTVLIPASYTSETGDAKLGTYKIGQIARAAAVFGCDRVVVYDDDPSDEAIPLVLRYAVTPPYLRKELFERREELRYAGAVPPLRIPPHTVSDREGSETQQEYRQGVVTDVASDGRVWVDCGTQHPVALRVPDHIREGIREGKRVTLRISSREPLRAEVVSPDNVPLYWGYEVVEASLVEWLDGFVDDGGVAVSTSRKGRRVEEDDLTHEKLALVFGSPERGVDEILREYYGATYDFDATVNTVPEQRTETVRTEEAVFATLSYANLVRS